MEGRRRRPSFWAEPPRITAFAPAEPIRHTDTSAFGDPQSRPEHKSSNPNLASADTQKIGGETNSNGTPLVTKVFVATTHHGAETVAPLSGGRTRLPEPAR